MSKSKKCPRCKAKMTRRSYVHVDHKGSRRIYYYVCPDCFERVEGHKERVTIR